MPSADLQVSLEEAVEQVLETMCFSSVDGACEAESAQSLLCRSAGVTYRGASQGTVYIGCDEGAAQTLAANFLGEETSSESQVVEFLAELANMICGAWVSTLEGDQHFTLSPPLAVPPSTLAAPGGVRRDFSIEGGVLSVVAFAQVAA